MSAAESPPWMIGTGQVRRFHLRHELLITRTSGVMLIGFALNALLHALPGLLPRRG